MKTIVKIDHAVPRLPQLSFVGPIDWTIREGEQWAVVGPNGAGKTLLADMLQRMFALKEGEVVWNCEEGAGFPIKSIAFKDIYSLADCRNTYYQQRWHSTETDDVPVVEDLLKEYSGKDDMLQMLSFFGIADLMPKKLIFLSSGELRKFLIVRSLLSHPRILVLDNPFIGLDASSRGVLVDLLQQMTKLKSLQVVLLLSNPDDIPEMVTHVLPLYGRKIYEPQTRDDFMADKELQAHLFPDCTQGLLLPPSDKEPSEHEVTFRMEHVFIKYGNRTILKDLDWEVKNGEKWALFGPNGSGKSTLLSLIYADNPQSYANHLFLFDRKRGSGESIWDIKKRIGYVSPEMHLYYMENVPTLNIVASGFFDSIGLFRKCTEEQQSVALAWMKVFGIDGLKERSFLTLSSGEQRLALLARAFVKDPELIILDEPLHGLDISNKRKAAHVIELFCARKGKTLVYVTHYPHELPICVSRHFELVKHPVSE